MIIYFIRLNRKVFFNKNVIFVWIFACFYFAGYILNWSGEVSPVVHQLDHYLDELKALAEIYEKKMQV